MVTIGLGVKQRSKQRRLQDLSAAVRTVWDMVTRSMMWTVICILGAALLLMLWGNIHLAELDKAVPDNINTISGIIVGGLLGLLIPSPVSRTSTHTAKTEREEDDAVRK